MFYLRISRRSKVIQVVSRCQNSRNLNMEHSVKLEKEIKKIAVVAHVLQTTQSLVISRCCFAGDAKPLFCLLDPFFCDVAVVVFLNSLICIRYRDSCFHFMPISLKLICTCMCYAPAMWHAQCINTPRDKYYERLWHFDYALFFLLIGQKYSKVFISSS